MKKNGSKGFTLIELLVVIAIIGILASVVLASLNSARARGADARVKSQLANARAQAEIYYDSGNTYAGVCDNAAFKNLLTGLTSTVCGQSATGWAVSAPLTAVSGKYWCADYTGASKQIDAALSGATDIEC